MSESAVQVRRDGAVTVITLNRPDQANAINAELIRDLYAATTELAADAETKVVLITGAGKHFCAGADLKEDPQRRRESRARYGVARDMSRLPQPVIAAINGHALGGGCEIALTCDFRIIAADAEIGLPEIRFGLLPLGGGTARLPRLVGIQAARRMIMLGDPVDAEQAERIGLVDGVTAAGRTLAAANEFANRLLARSDYAVQAAKKLLCRTLDVDLESALDLERTTVREMATKGQFIRERDAARQTPTYARIFGDADAAQRRAHTADTQSCSGDL